MTIGEDLGNLRRALLERSHGPRWISNFIFFAGLWLWLPIAVMGRAKRAYESLGIDPR